MVFRLCDTQENRHGNLLPHRFSMFLQPVYLTEILKPLLFAEVFTI